MVDHPAFRSERDAQPSVAEPPPLPGLLAVREPARPERAGQGQALSQEEIIATAILLLIAGNETATHLISGGRSRAAPEPGPACAPARRSGADRAAVEELLRYTGPVQATGRVLKEDMDVAGQPMKAGQITFLLLAAANRDPDKYPGPDRLDIGRNPPDHLAFGDGIHFCLGAPLARAEAQIAIGTLVQRFPELRLAGEVEWGGAFIIRGPRTMPVAVE